MLSKRENFFGINNGEHRRFDFHKAEAVKRLPHEKFQTVAMEQATDDNATNLTLAENTINSVSDTGSDVFPLILLMVLIAVFVGIISLVKVLA